MLHLLLMRKISIEIFKMLRETGKELQEDWKEFNEKWLNWEGGEVINPVIPRREIKPQTK